MRQWLIALVGGFVVSCGNSSPPPAAPGAASSDAPSATSAPASSPAAATASASPPLASADTSQPPDPLVGQAAPDFTAATQDGTSFHLSALKGKSVVVYFYPKDETPGCTKEACSFRDSWQSIAKTGAALVGVSADTLDSHKQFIAHYGLPFSLVSDPDGSIGKKYGVPFEGHHARQTFVVGPDGKVRKVYRKVDVTVHASQVLADLTGP